MTGIRSLLVQLDDAPASAMRLARAVSLHRVHRAALAAMAVMSPQLESPALAFTEIPAASLDSHDDAQAHARIRVRFDEIASGLTPVAHWLEGGADAAGEFRHQALCADLMVLGPHDPETPGRVQAPQDFVETMLLTAGKPALVLPSWTSGSVGRRVLIGWNASVPAARAVQAALPWLAVATSVHVLESSDARPTTGARALDLFGYLRLHGIAAERLRPGRGADAGAMLLERAAELGSDLLVMGCYGHGRLREFVLGGATRKVLAELPLPVLMAH